MKEERKKRKNREEYQAIVSVINEHPSREETQKEIEKLNKELQSLSEEASATSTKFDLRVKQFQLLLFAVNQLQQTLQTESSNSPEPMETTNESSEIKINPLIKSNKEPSEKNETMMDLH